MKIYIATGNPAKLANFQELFSKIDPTIKTEMVPQKIEVEEVGQTIAQNSLLKVLPYKGKYQSTVIANDFGLEFEEKVTELKAPSKVKRSALGGKDPSDLEQHEIGKIMLDYYKSIARKYGGKVACTAHDTFSAIFPDGSTKQSHAVREYELVDREVREFDIYHPLNSLRISPKIGRFIDEFSNEDKMKDFEPLIEALRELVS
ncbi:hypothetical protein GF357_00795 [Candidatus Dojkabacteria bacterium]|nr:hypothetical protein [Candidatus Dojkabacteria bacterium]